jgi:hypothetical protein
MKLRWLTILLGIALCTGALHAQVGIYGALSLDRRHVSDVLASPPPGSDNTAAAWPYGFTVGVYDDFAHLGPICFGTDVRGEFVRGSFVSDTVLFGLRLAVKPPALPIKPYVQASLGMAHIDGSDGASSTNNLEYRFAGGLDFTLLPRLDWRVVEVSRGALVDYTFGSGQNQSNSLYTFSSGLVFRIP